MKQKLILLLTLFVGGIISAQAQVTIGSQDEPHAGAVLELKSDSKGLLLPRVELEGPTIWTLTGTETDGMMVFHTGNENMEKGTYVWTVNKWIKVSEGDQNVCPMPDMPGSISFTSTFINHKGTFTASVEEVSGATSYEWILPSGLEGSSESNSIEITGESVKTYAVGTISVRAQNSCGVSPKRTNSTAITVAGIPITDITINGNNTIIIGEPNAYTATVLPENASNKSIEWELVENALGRANFNASTGILTGTVAGLVGLVATATDGSSSGSKVIMINPNEQQLSVSPSNITLASPAATTVTLDVTSSGSWTATGDSNPSGTSISSSSGTGNSSVVVTIPANTTTLERTITYVFKSSDEQVSRIATITQPGVILRLSSSTGTMSDWEGGLITGVTVTSNVAWKITTTTSGASVSPSSATVPAGTTVTGEVFTIPKYNTSTKDRTITFILSAQDGSGISKTYTVTQSGPSYTTWAGSNVYWDGTKLTFDTAITTANQKKQGVYFKWGSLDGIAPKGRSGTINWNSSEYTVYTVTSNGSSYYEFNTSTYWNLIGAWDVIPRLLGILEPSQAHDPSASVRTGDICKLISDNEWVTGTWRMPTQEEFGTVSDYNETIFSSTNTNSIDGKGTINTYKVKRGQTNPSGQDVIFPASGRRDPGSGSQSDFGYVGMYWSGSSYSSSYGYAIGFGGYDEKYINTFTHSGFTGNWALPVRCVRID